MAASLLVDHWGIGSHGSTGMRNGHAGLNVAYTASSPTCPSFIHEGHGLRPYHVSGFELRDRESSILDQ
jgi:hypothetical protein